MPTSSKSLPERRKFIEGSDQGSIDLIVVGASAGGISALKQLFLSLPEGFRIPIVIVQHFSAESKELLPDFFSSFSTLKIKEVEDKESLSPGFIYFAPANYHVLVSKKRRLHLSVDEPVFYCRPSIDILFETAAEAFNSRLLAVILTGANEDGARGAASVERHGGKVAIQDLKDAEFPTMPREALRKVSNPDLVGKMGQICAFISGL